MQIVQKDPKSKLITTIKIVTCAKRKSAKPRSGEIDENWDLLAGFTCNSKLFTFLGDLLINDLEAKADTEDEGGNG